MPEAGVGLEGEGDQGEKPGLAGVHGRWRGEFRGFCAEDDLGLEQGGGVAWPVLV